MTKFPLSKLAFLLLFFSVATAETMACEYGPPYRTVCQTFAQADTVISGVIESVVLEDFKQTVSIKVAKTYKGESRKKIVVHQPISSCDWDFRAEEDKTLLLYLARDEETGEFSAISEGMGGRIDRNAENLYWLNNLPQSLSRTRISGTVEAYRDESFEFLNYVYHAQVKIFNEKNSFETFTDNNGVYEIWDIPAGKYRIRADLPPDLNLRFNLERGLVDSDTLRKTNPSSSEVLVEIEPNGCGGIDFVTNKIATK